MTIKNLADSEKKTKRRNEVQQTETALESAVAALIMSYVNEREEKKKNRQESRQMFELWTTFGLIFDLFPAIQRGSRARNEKARIHERRRVAEAPYCPLFFNS